MLTPQLVCSPLTWHCNLTSCDCTTIMCHKHLLHGLSCHSTTSIFFHHCIVCKCLLTNWLGYPKHFDTKHEEEDFWHDPRGGEFVYHILIIYSPNSSRWSTAASKLMLIRRSIELTCKTLSAPVTQTYLMLLHRQGAALEKYKAQCIEYQRHYLYVSICLSVACHFWPFPKQCKQGFASKGNIESYCSP